jgi:succinyl-CoA synthetase beta subunit
LSVDDNALYRTPIFRAMRDLNEEAPLEIEAANSTSITSSSTGVSPVLVNGAGLAMATMDIIQHYGGSPANLSRCGGGGLQGTSHRCFKIILQDPT